jgi:FKBP-type peptidyl-prolyl cis-trans isomerase (trigger factor)
MKSYPGKISSPNRFRNQIPAETTKKAYESTIEKFMRQANIPGFRKGKVPHEVIVQRFGLGNQGDIPRRFGRSIQ